MHIDDWPQAAVRRPQTATMSHAEPPPNFTANNPLRLIVGPNDSGLCMISESQPEFAVTGVVELHLRYAQEKQLEKVSLTFSGIVRTRIKHGERAEHDSEKPCNDQTIVLWEIGSAFPPPGDHILRLPFSIAIPHDVPPSLDVGSVFLGRHSAHIRYKLCLFGERRVTFGLDTRIERWLTVIPPCATYRAGEGEYSWEATAEMRRSLFTHGKGFVKMEICFPTIGDGPFQIDTRIPFIITVRTFSIPVYPMTDPETDKEARFPSIDISALHSLLRLRVKRYTSLRVRGVIFSKQETLRSHRILLGDLDKQEALNVDIGPKEWVLYSGNDQKLRGKGHWTQTLTFHSSMILSSDTVIPTFTSTLVDVRYTLRLRCTIPGQSSIIHDSLVPDNHVKIKIPIVISSRPASVSAVSAAPLTDADIGIVYRP